MADGTGLPSLDSTLYVKHGNEISLDLFRYLFSLCVRVEAPNAADARLRSGSG